MTKRSVVPSANQSGVGELATGLPAVPTFEPAIIAAEVGRIAVRSQEILESTQRAVINTDEAAGKATEFLAAIRQTRDSADDARTKLTGPIDKALKALNALYTKGPIAKLDLAKETLTAKLSGYMRKKRELEAAEAKAREEALRQETIEQAKDALYGGDAEGAQELLQAAATVRVEPERTVIRGATTTLAGVKRKVGRVHDVKAFLFWLAESKTQSAMAMIGGVTFGQRELNQLAAAVLVTQEKDPAAGIPGFTAEIEETFGAR